MKKGEVLNGYRVVSEPTNAGAGMSQWAVADRGGDHYFLKMFLSPKYPLPNSPGSEAGKLKRLEECRDFEQRQLEIVKRLRPDAPGGGHLVSTLEFFRVGTSYYKITRLVTPEDRMSLEECSVEARVVALRSLFFSLKLLHDEQVVHGDLKPENVLFQKTPAGVVTCQLIDFDEAYVSRQAPPRERIVGDPRYYSPELFRYVKEDPAVEASDLTTASDIFALGVLVYALMAGRLPDVPDGSNYPCEAVVKRHQIKLRRQAVDPVMRDVLPAMLAARPEHRPTIDEVIAASKGHGRYASATRPKGASAPSRARAPESAPIAPGGSKLRSTFGRDPEDKR